MELPEQIARVNQHLRHGSRCFQQAAPGEDYMYTKQYLLGSANGEWKSSDLFGMLIEMALDCSRFCYPHTLAGCPSFPIPVHTTSWSAHGHPHAWSRNSTSAENRHLVWVEICSDKAEWEWSEQWNIADAATSKSLSLTMWNYWWILIIRWSIQQQPEQPEQQQSHPNNLTKTFCCWPSKTGPLSVTVTIFQTHFIPGQAVSVQGKVINNSGLHVHEVIFELRQLLIHGNQTLTRLALQKDHQTISRHRAAGVAKTGEQIYMVDLPFPLQPLSGQQVAFFAYNVRLTAAIRTRNNPFVEIPITIGNAASPLTWRASENLEYNAAYDEPTELDSDAAPETPTNEAELRKKLIWIGFKWNINGLRFFFFPSTAILRKGCGKKGSLTAWRWAVDGRMAELRMEMEINCLKTEPKFSFSFSALQMFMFTPSENMAHRIEQRRYTRWSITIGYALQNYHNSTLIPVDSD